MIKQKLLIIMMLLLVVTTTAVGLPKSSINEREVTENHIQSAMNKLTKSLDIGESESQVKILFSPSMYAESDEDKRREYFSVWLNWVSERSPLVLENLASVERLLSIGESKVSGDILNNLIAPLHFLNLEPDASVDWLAHFLKYKKIDINQCKKDSLMELAIQRMNAPAAQLLKEHGYIVTEQDLERFKSQLEEAKALDKFGYNDRADALQALENINATLSAAKFSIKQ